MTTGALVSGLYTVGTSQTVSKDFSSLQISLSLTCVSQADEMDRLLSDIIMSISTEIEAQSDFKLVSLNPEVKLSSGTQYQKRFDKKEDQNRLNPYFVDTCNNDAKVSIKDGLDLTKKYFVGSTVVKIETKENFS